MPFWNSFMVRVPFFVTSNLPAPPISEKVAEIEDEGFVLVDHNSSREDSADATSASVMTSATTAVPKIKGQTTTNTTTPPSATPQLSLPNASPTTQPAPQNPPMSDAQKVELLMFGIDAESCRVKNDRDWRIQANLSLIDRDIWLYNRRQHALSTLTRQKVSERDTATKLSGQETTVTHLNDELWILDCARRRVDGQFRARWGFVPPVRPEGWVPEGRRVGFGCYGRG